METEINEIKEMIVQDQLLEAIRLSLEKNFLLVFHDELLIIQSNLTELLRRENIGVLETSHYLIQKNRIRESLLNILRKALENKDVYNPLEDQQGQISEVDLDDWGRNNEGFLSRIVRRVIKGM